MNFLKRLALVAGALVVACALVVSAVPSGRAATPAGGVDRTTGIATCNALIPTNGVGAITAANVRQCITLMWNSTLVSLSNLADCASLPACLANLSGVSGPGSTTVGHFATWGNTTGTQLLDSGTVPGRIVGLLDGGVWGFRLSAGGRCRQLRHSLDCALSDDDVYASSYCRSIRFCWADRYCTVGRWHIQ